MKRTPGQPRRTKQNNVSVITKGSRQRVKHGECRNIVPRGRPADVSVGR